MLSTENILEVLNPRLKNIEIGIKRGELDIRVSLARGDASESEFQFLLLFENLVVFFFGHTIWFRKSGRS